MRPADVPNHRFGEDSCHGLDLAGVALVLIFAGAGFALHVLWIVAVVLLLVWILGFLVSGAEHSWYRVQRR